MPAAIKLTSDFSDYYDSAFMVNGDMEYRRMQSECMTRGKALGWLKLHNIPTIETKPVKEFNRSTEKIVVYTNTKLRVRLYAPTKKLLTIIQTTLELLI